MSFRIQALALPTEPLIFQPEAAEARERVMQSVLALDVIIHEMRATMTALRTTP